MASFADELGPRPDPLNGNRSAKRVVGIALFVPVIGPLAIRASATGDLGQQRIIGLYLPAASAVGEAAFPASPLWAPLLQSLPLVAIGQGWIAP